LPTALLTIPQKAHQRVHILIKIWANWADITTISPNMLSVVTVHFFANNSTAKHLYLQGFRASSVAKQIAVLFPCLSPLYKVPIFWLEPSDL
jgi:hypothetical protein